MKHVVVNTLAALFVIAGMGIRPVLANDTAAVLGVGGLELTTSDDIIMVSEDLYLSPDEIRVRYTFRNESSRDITTTVAFPLPPIDQSAHSEIVFLPMEDQENFVGFRVWVDGQPIQPKLEQKATTDSDADMTAELSRAGLPVNASLPGWKAKLYSLPNDLRQQLIKQGLLDVESGRANSPSAEFSPNWTLEATFHWDQTFPAGKTIVVEHRYKPIVGGVSFFDASQIGDYKDYCLDDQGKTGVRRLLQRGQVVPREVSYVLTTGANWKGPIGDFLLTIDKEKPNAVLSICMNGLRKTGPTTFETRQTNFTPTEDIRFVIFEGQ